MKMKFLFSFVEMFKFKNNFVCQADGEKGEKDGTEHEKDEPKNKLEVFLHGERMSTDMTLTNGQTTSQDNNHHNHHHDHNDDDDKEEMLDSNL